MAEKTSNGRPSKLGSMYFEKTEFGGYVRKYCVGYCPKCKTKIGLTAEELKEFSQNLPGFIPSFFARLFKARIIIP